MEKLLFTLILVLAVGIIYLITGRNRRQINKIPEGMAIGVAFGSAAAGDKAAFAAACMLALAAPRAMAKTYEVGMDASFIKFGDAVEAINQSGDAENEIVLMENITLTGNYTLDKGKKTTIKGKEGEDRKISINGSGAGITVTGEKTTLNLGANGYDKKLTIEGDTGVAFITVSGGATANMYENVTLQGGGSENEPSKPAPRGVYVKEEGSAFNLHGGVIENCSRAVIAESEATFHMSGGEIRNCRGGSGNGGGVHVYGATFVMSGGTISRCSAGAGGGLYATYSSKITINKGTISECSASEGGGLYVDGSTLTIEGGTISGCTASGAGMGGGLCAYNSIIAISGGTIEKNKAIYGGGVALNNSWINPITNWTVIDNEAYKTEGRNGGIGGGIYLDNEKDKPTMDISNGLNKIYNNTAVGHGADICLDGRTSSIKLPDAANMGATFGDSGIKIDNWYNDNTGKAVTSLQLNGKQSLVASYEASPVRIEIDANGGVGGSVSQTVQKGTTVPVEAPTKEGYLFKGWKDDKGNSYPAGADGKVNITVNEDMKLTAVWEARTFTVTYVLLNGETRTEKVDYGQMVTLSEEPRTGYTFVGWKDGEKMYHAGETITVTGDMTLTAEWKKLPSAENLPKTGDESPVLLWGAALAVSAAACFMLRRRK